jgi:hypothetical protein
VSLSGLFVKKSEKDGPVFNLSLNVVLCFTEDSGFADAVAKQCENCDDTESKGFDEFLRGAA